LLLLLLLLLLPRLLLVRKRKVLSRGGERSLLRVNKRIEHKGIKKELERVRGPPGGPPGRAPE